MYNCTPFYVSFQLYPSDEHTPAGGRTAQNTIAPLRCSHRNNRPITGTTHTHTFMHAYLPPHTNTPHDMQH